MSRRRKNPHPQRAVNARTVLKAEKEEEPLVLRSRMMIPDAEDDEDEEANRQRRRKGKKGEKNSKSAERSVARGERENRAKTMIPPNANQKPDEPVPAKPALDATTTISPPALMQQKVSPKGGMQLPPIPPLPEHLKNADTETKLLYFREAKRVLIEKCRENRCGNDEVTRETHGLGEFTSGWKRPGLRECTAQEFAYDFFKFHEQRGEFDYENVWEYVLVRSRLMFFMIIYGGRHREMRSFFFARASSRRRRRRR